jgi:uncharacterized protein
VTLADVNVLVYAFRPDTDFHSPSYRWLAETMSARETFGVSPLALSALVRISTNQRAHKVPSTTADALAFCDDLLGLPNCRIVEPGPAHWDIFRRLCLETNTRGPMITDVWYAALAIEHDCEFVTYDRDFARFPGLRWRMPG